ncbi:hypothetical protein DIPPA_16021 [Diplonema papillatum]|nr:hypothetical protein DIPPA_16021 [Diplonema papillatum]
MSPLAEAIEKTNTVAKLVSECPLGSWDDAKAGQLQNKLMETTYAVRSSSRTKNDAMTESGKDRAKLADILKMEKSKAGIEVIKPHKNSAPVALVTTNDGWRAVMKCRGWYEDKSRREETCHRLAGFLKLDSVVSPISAARVQLQPPDSDTTVAAQLGRVIYDAYMDDDGFAPEHEWICLEKMVRVLPHSDAVPDGKHKTWLPKVLANKHGFCDVATAYLSCPSGLLTEHSAHLQIRASADMTDDHFVEVIKNISQQHLEKLALFHTVILQRDGTPVNTLLECVRTGGRDAEQPYEIRLISIDNTRTFGSMTEDELNFSLDNDDPDRLAYWYPCFIGFPGVLKPLSDSFRKEVLGWDAGAVQSFLELFLIESGAPAALDAQRCADRVRKLQAFVRDSPNSSIRDIAFHVVPSWKRDWDAAGAGGELGPLPDFEKLVSEGRPFEDWTKVVRARNVKSLLKKRCSQIALAAAVVAAVLKIRSSRS